MKSFDEFCKKHELKRNLDYVELAWEAGQQSKQDEVDELQKRIDSVIEYLDGCDSCCDISKLHLIEVLQGDQ